MSNIVDAKGLSCPQPVILTLNAIKKAADGELIILVDTDTAKENVIRTTESQGWKAVDIKPENDGYKITLRKG
ncbi:MAG: sulfurtransferase TusA family protein [Syntrophomonadaceae bacterium]|jgi:tRNA 2-thiouridine synthesizing protein A